MFVSMHACMHGHVSMSVYVCVYVLKLRLSCFAKMYRRLRHMRWGLWIAKGHERATWMIKLQLLGYIVGWFQGNIQILACWDV